MGAGMTQGGTPANFSLGRFDNVDYTRAADVNPGDMVLVGSLYGLDTQGGLNGTMGALMIEGGIDMSDAGGVDPAIGAKVGFNFTTQQITAAAGGDADVGFVVAKVPGRAHVKLVQGL